MKEQLHSVEEFFTSFFGLKTPKLNLAIMFLTFIGTQMRLVLEGSESIFFAIAVVVFADLFFGIAANWRDFRTTKALKVVWYLGGYYIIAGVCLSLEEAFKSAFWLTETIVFPILGFQLVSILKNASKAGLIKARWLVSILKNIDRHKDEYRDRVKETIIDEYNEA